VTGAAAAALVFAAINASGGARSPRNVTVHVIEHAVSDATTNKAIKAGDAAGDILTFANPVFDVADKNQVGSDQGFCVRITAGKAYECMWTTFLPPAGQITVEGPFYDKGLSRLAITGGTGDYQNPRGTMVLKARNKTEFHFVFTLS
jgi:allene oxide cyclase